MADQRWTEADVQAVLARQKPHSAVLAPYSPQEPRRTLGVPEDDEELESAFMARIRRLARQYGWATYHTHDSRKSDKGFPDLVLVRETILFVELKTNTGKLTQDQATWLSLLAHTNSHIEVYVWRPENWALVEERLTRKRTQ